MPIKIPGKATISNRSSTMASQFARARAPYIPPTVEQIKERYAFFQIDPEQPTCAYCGGPQTEWDHLFPMVQTSRWTGYYTEIDNLIPACGKCNQSRGSKPVGAWMRSRAPQSPMQTLTLRDNLAGEALHAEIERRIYIIESVVAARPPSRMTADTCELETELEKCRLELSATLIRAEGIAAQLRKRYHARATSAASLSHEDMRILPPQTAET